MFKKILLKLFLLFIQLLPPKASCLLNNIRMKVYEKKIIFSYDKNKKLFYVTENKKKIYFNEKMRGINTYSYGISNRAFSLAKTYNLDLVNFKNGDVLIDCGANFGDIFIWTQLKNLKIKYISFEPSFHEYRCLKLNCINQINNNIALSNQNKKSIFFINSRDGDSSLIEPATGYSEKLIIDTIKLETYVMSKNIKKIKFFKCEAEGAEPEILEGSESILDRIEYIGVDGSPERGLKSESTIEYAISFLKNKNFEIVKKNINQSYSKVLFKNKYFIK